MRLRNPIYRFKVHKKLTQARLLIPERVMKQLYAYVNACPVEVNGFGLVRNHGNMFVLDEVYILTQTASYVHVEIDDNALASDASRLGDRYEQRRFQWHSHVDFGAFFSETDLANIARSGEDWLISMVLNQQGFFDARLDRRVKGKQRQYPLKVTVVLEPDLYATALAQAEIAQHVTIVNTMGSRIAGIRDWILRGGS